MLACLLACVHAYVLTCLFFAPLLFRLARILFAVWMRRGRQIAGSFVRGTMLACTWRWPHVLYVLTELFTYYLPTALAPTSDYPSPDPDQLAAFPVKSMPE